MTAIAINTRPSKHTSDEMDPNKNVNRSAHEFITDSQDGSPSMNTYSTSNNKRGEDKEIMDVVESKSIQMNVSKDEDEVVVIDDDSSTNDTHKTSTLTNNSNHQMTIDTIDHLHELSKIDLQQKEQVYSEMKIKHEKTITKLKESILQLEDGKDPLDLVHLNQRLIANDSERDQLIIRFEDFSNQVRQFLDSNRLAPILSTEQHITSLQISNEQTARFEEMFAEIATSHDSIAHDKTVLQSSVEQCKEAIALKEKLKAESDQLIITNNMLDIIDERIQDLLLEEELEKEEQAQKEIRQQKEIERLARLEAEEEKRRQDEQEYLANLEAIRKRRETFEIEKSAKKARLSVGKI